MTNMIASALAESARVAGAMARDPDLQADVHRVAQLVLSILKGGGKLLFAGNGGSAAEAQHMAAEYVGRYKFDRPPMPAIALTTDTSILTAISNDYGYDHVFVRQIEALGRQGDLLFVSSTSGRSQSVLHAIATARRLGISTVLLTGEGYEVQSDRPDLVLAVPSCVTARIQEGHLVIGHAICELVEQHMFGAAASACIEDSVPRDETAVIEV